ncbi:FAD-dependent monooxygenase [Kribbella speibonae]|uniref:FAD-dependent oxidoreductase n=1 Tax=Kribbella speibonae TaxID=1572660 RepID=A0ABY1ZWC4_9ACTN|nr:FAD-dependent monooxygenase [Kribbella speibonae]TCC18918.1 FAD-dependent oxidoreductase [Kribbella speibonae]
MTNRRVLIVGASIAGPALAWWLRHHGFTVTVVERASALRPGGYKIDIRGAAIDVVEQMGLKEQLEGLETDMQVMSFVNKAGKRLASVPADLFMGRGEADLEVMRGDLSRILYDATRADVEYIFGDTVVGVDQADGTVTFKNGEPRTFDVVVGADGLHSVVRELTFGAEQEFVNDLGHLVSIGTVPNHLGLDRQELIYSAPGRTLNLYSTGKGHDAKALFLFTAPGLTYDRHDVQAQQRILDEAFRGAGWETDLLLDEIARADDFYFDTVSQVGLKRYGEGRVSLVGDAAYCPSFASGQGTSLALVGAYVLAGELAKADHPEAFAAYERTMRPFVERNLQLGRDNLGRMVSKSAFQSWIGAALMRVLPKLPGKDSMIEKMTKPIHDAARAIDLPQYRTAADDHL